MAVSPTASSRALPQEGRVSVWADATTQVGFETLHRTARGTANIVNACGGPEKCSSSSCLAVWAVAFFTLSITGGILMGSANPDRIRTGMILTKVSLGLFGAFGALGLSCSPCIAAINRPR